MAEALALVDAATAEWRGHRRPDRSERLRLTERVAQALAQGASPEQVRWALTRDLSLSQVRTTAVQVVMARTARPGWADVDVPAPRSAVDNEVAAEVIGRVRAADWTEQEATTRNGADLARRLLRRKAATARQ